MSEPKRTTPSSIPDIDSTTGQTIKDKISRDLNPGGEETESTSGGLSHNRGRPKAPPHSKDGTVASTATFLTDCAKQHSESLQCIERNYQNRSACEPFFQAYKNCRKEENEARRDKAGGSGTGSGWFW
jgi:cytochrome c oxidase assembly protein subunit 23